MDKALSIILGSSSCIDLLKSLEESMHNIELSSLLSMSIDYDGILNFMFQEYKQKADLEAFSPYAIPDYVHIALAILAVILGEAYVKKFSLRFSRLYKLKVLDKLDDENLIRFGHSLGIKLEYSKNRCFKEIFYSITKSDTTSTLCYRYRIPIGEYLRIARKLLTEYAWRLSAFIVSKGYVYIDNKDKVLRLLTEHIYNITSSKLKTLALSCKIGGDIKDKLVSILQDLDSDLAKSIDTFLQKHSQHEATPKPNIVPERVKPIEEINKVSNLEELIGIAKVMFPPCIQNLIELLTKGENLSHHQRFAVATFLINLGVDLDVILKLFSLSPDFNEKITRYQIEHLAGLRGSKKKYLVYSCNTMKMLGICKADCGIKNPLVYLRKVGREVKLR